MSEMQCRPAECPIPPVDEDRKGEENWRTASRHLLHQTRMWAYRFMQGLIVGCRAQTMLVLISRLGDGGRAGCYN